MDNSGTPRHIAIIMDGNGRWAQRRRKPRVYGHVWGCRRVKEIVREADRLGVQALTLFTFSTENWHRPSEEVGVLFKLLRKWLLKEQKELMDMNIRVKAIGAIDKLPVEAREIVEDTVRKSANNTGLQLTLALSYGGREEIVTAARRLAQEVKLGQLSADEIDEKLFSSQLSNPDVGDPDLLIRTSGEVRISNFLLWQLAYSELYFTDTMWPDFTAAELQRAVASYIGRQRRFGLTSEQTAEAALHH